MNKIWLAVSAAVFLMISAVGAMAMDDQGEDVAGAVYAMTNAADGNAIVVFERDGHGLLSEADIVATGGNGAGDGLDPLASQGALVLSANHRWLLAVNAGSNEVSVLRVAPDGLELVDTVGSGGELPVSVTVFHDLVYVLNAGMSPNITGFYLTHAGQLLPIDDSTRPLDAGAYSQVGFDPRGGNLVVTDRGDQEILVFAVDRDGLPAADAVVSPSSGVAPFGFIFDRRGHLLVSEAGSGSASSYEIQPDGTLEVISAAVANGQAATCWIAGNRRGDVYTANTGSQNISQYRVHKGSGALDLVEAVAAGANRPIDMAVSENGRFLYALDPADGAVHMYRIGHRGALTDLGAAPSASLSIFAQGIAAR